MSGSSFKRIAPTVGKLLVTVIMATMDAAIYSGFCSSVKEAAKESWKEIEEGLLNAYPYYLQLEDLFFSMKMFIREFIMGMLSVAADEKMNEMRLDYNKKRSRLLGTHLYSVPPKE